MGKNIAHTLIGKERDEYLFHRYTREHLAEDAPRIPLSDQQKEEVDALWGDFRYKPDYAWHEYFWHCTGEFDARYIAKDVWVCYLLPYINNRNLAYAYEDKSYYTRHYPDVPFVHSLGYCINGRLYNEAYEPTDYTSLLNHLRNWPEVLVKASLYSLCSKSIEIFDPATATEQTLQALVEQRGGNCAFQELIVQHEVPASLNPSSCNTIRMTTLRVDNTIYNLGAAIRFGSPGDRTDVNMDGEHSLLRLLAIDDEGIFFETGWHSDGRTFPATEVGMQPGTALPGYEQARELCMRTHENLHHFDMIGFDFAIDVTGAPVMIEMNISDPGIVYQQFCHGPLFGQHTEAVLERVRERRRFDDQK